MNAWNSREVRFTLFPRAPSADIDQGLDALADHFYTDWRQWTMGGVVASCERTITVGGFKWWVPARLAVHLVVKVMEREGIAGTAVFVRERNYLGPE